MRPEEFIKGLARIALACRGDLDDATAEVYAEALADQVDVAEWERFTLGLVRSGRFTFIPTVAEILDALRESRSGRSLETEAGEAYQRVLSCGQYTPAGGTTWAYTTVLRSCGEAAAEAFVAAGDSEAFESTWDAGRRRRLFLREYQSRVRQDHTTALLPAGTERPALSAGEPVSTDDARDLLAHVAERVEASR